MHLLRYFKKDNITYLLNNLLIIYAFLIPINNDARKSVFFVIFVLFIVRANYSEYLKDVIKNKIMQAILIFYGITLLGFIYSDNIAYAYDTLHKAKYLLFPLLFLSFLDIRYTNRVLSAFLLGVFVSEIVSYLIILKMIPSQLFLYGHKVYKVFAANDPAPFIHHLDHNILLAMTIAILLYQVFNKHTTLIVKIFTILFFITASVNMSFIGSRTGYVLYIFLLYIVLLLSYKKHIVKILFISSLASIVTISLALHYSPMVKSKLQQTITSIEKMSSKNDYNSSLGLRVGFAKYSFKVISDNFFIGVGTGDHMDSVRALIPNEYAYLKDPVLMKEVHNVYLQTLLQFGVIGLFSFLLIFYRMWICEGCSSYNRGIIIILVLATLLYMIPGKFFGHFVLPMFGLVLSTMIINIKRKIVYSPLSVKVFLVYTLVTVVFLIIGILK